MNSTRALLACGAFVAVTWAATADGKGDVMIATSRDGGTVFDAPVRVNTQQGEARVSGEIAPRVALQPRTGSDPVVTVTWNAKDTTTHIKTARSVDGGRTFAGVTALTTAGAGDRGGPAPAWPSRRSARG